MDARILRAAGDGATTLELQLLLGASDTPQVDVAPGETIRFVITNDGFVPHEFRLTNSHAVEEHLTQGHGDHGEEPEKDLLLEVAAGETDELIATFTADSDFELIACLLPGHYEAGMAAALTITS